MSKLVYLTDSFRKENRAFIPLLEQLIGAQHKPCYLYATSMLYPHASLLNLKLDLFSSVYQFLWTYLCAFSYVSIFILISFKYIYFLITYRNLNYLVSNFLIFYCKLRNIKFKLTSMSSDGGCLKQFLDCTPTTKQKRLKR